MTIRMVHRRRLGAESAAPLTRESAVRPASALTPLALALSMALFLPACSKPAGDAGAPAATEAAATATPEQIKAESERLNAWFDAKYEEQLRKQNKVIFDIFSFFQTLQFIQYLCKFIFQCLVHSRIPGYYNLFFL